MIYILAFSDYKKLKHITLDSAHKYVLNGSYFMLLTSIYVMISLNVLKSLNYNNSSYIGLRDIKLLPFDLSWCDESNDMYFIFL